MGLSSFHPFTDQNLSIHQFFQAGAMRIMSSVNSLINQASRVTVDGEFLT